MASSRSSMPFLTEGGAKLIDMPLPLGGGGGASASAAGGGHSSRAAGAPGGGGRGVRAACGQEDGTQPPSRCAQQLQMGSPIERVLRSTLAQGALARRRSPAAASPAVACRSGAGAWIACWGRACCCWGRAAPAALQRVRARAVQLILFSCAAAARLQDRQCLWRRIEHQGAKASREVEIFCQVTPAQRPAPERCRCPQRGAGERRDIASSLSTITRPSSCAPACKSPLILPLLVPALAGHVTSCTAFAQTCGARASGQSYKRVELAAAAAASAVQGRPAPPPPPPPPDRGAVR